MKWLMISGGFPMYFVLLFGLIGLGAAILFAIRPEPRRVDTVRALDRATLFSILSGITSDLCATGWNVTHRLADEPDKHLLVLTGFAESMAPGILGFTLLSLTWLVMAVGHRRLGRQLGTP